MRYLRISLFFSIFLVFLIVGCADGQQDLSPENGNQKCFSGKVLKKVKKQKGTVYFDVYEKRYGIYVSIPGTIDSQDVGFLCGDSSSIHKDGLSVTFSGNYFSYDPNRKPPVGGQQYYFLEIKDLKIEGGK